MSTIQKTNYTNYYSLMVSYGFDHLNAVNNHFLVYEAILAWWRQPNKWMILEQAFCWTLRGHSFLQYIKRVMLTKISHLLSQILSFELKSQLQNVKTLHSKFGLLDLARSPVAKSAQNWKKKIDGLWLQCTKKRCTISCKDSACQKCAKALRSKWHWWWS